MFGVVTFPLKLIGDMMSSLFSLLSTLFFPLRLQSDAHEPLQRRLTRLEEEVGRWKPLQDLIPKQLQAQHPAPVVGDHSQKLSVLETELANTRKVQRTNPIIFRICLLHLKDESCRLYPSL